MTLLEPRPNVRPQDIATTYRLWEMVKKEIEDGGNILGGAIARDGSELQHRYGVKELNDPESWPRVVWVPGDDTYSGGAVQNGAFNLPIKPVYMKTLGIVAYFHGEDNTMAEMMANDYICLLHKMFGATLTIQGGGVLNEDDERGDATWLQDGGAYRLAFGVMVPVAPVANFAAIRNPRLYTCADELVR